MKLAIGAVYSVFSRNGCVVSFSDGTECLSVPAEEVRLLLAQEEEMEVSDPAAIVSIVPNGAEVLHGVMMSSYSADKLPAGYTRLEFLEGSGNQYINIPRALNIDEDCSFVYKAQNTGGGDYQHAFGARVVANSQEFGLSYYIPSSTVNVMLGGGSGVYIPVELTEPHEIKVDGAAGTVVCGGKSYAISPVAISMSGIGIFRRSGIGYSYFVGRIFKVSIFNSGQQFMNMLPALDATGVPCMYDTVTKTAYKRAGSGQFIAGFTLAQARKLGKLPAGTILTISLPVGYDSDAGVVAALAAAETNGCVLTVQTYEAAGAAATFALRRVWVRRQQDGNGTYVDADGSRWQVDWCVDIIGADPESLGYERFRSVDAATEYWELVPYEYPAEELSNVE